MARAPYYRLFINEDDHDYLLARLWQSKSDGSLMLNVFETESGGGTLARIKIESNPFDIPFDKVNVPVAIDHTSIHATGQSHTKMKDGSLVINNDKVSQSIPLTELKTSKHITTLLCKRMTKEDEMPANRVNDVPLKRASGQNFSVVDVLALPGGMNVSLNVGWEMENDKPVNLTVSTYMLKFNGFDVVLFVRHSDQFETAPPKTIQLPDMNDKVPFVTKIDQEKMTVKISSLTFGQMVVPTDKETPPGFSSLTATSKYL